MKEELFILWTNDNLITTEKMVCMYGHNSKLKGWWDEVTIIVWGATAKLLGENKDLQKKFVEMQNDGVKISACKACADQLGVTEILENLGVEVIYWGFPLTELLKSNKKLLTI